MDIDIIYMIIIWYEELDQLTTDMVLFIKIMFKMLNFIWIIILVSLFIWLLYDYIKWLKLWILI